MVKKRGQLKSRKPGSGNAGQKNIAPSNSNDCFIVFSNPENESKQKRQDAKSSITSSAPKDKSYTPGQISNKPDVKKLIGGPSWTGKVPVNMLSEHCQKQRWEKPEYTMSKTPEGYSSMVILKAKDSKTKELVTLPPFRLPISHSHLALKSSALEARHFAAAYGLFRVCSMRNIHMMMPPDYRDLWKRVFETLKQEDIRAGRSWMYEADPFAVLRARNEMKATEEKRRLDQEKAKEILADSINGVRPVLRNDKFPLKHESSRGWHGAPKIEMGKKTREKIEELVRRFTIWNPYNVKLSKFQQNSIVVEFKDLGFRQSHIEEAVLDCKDRAETLEWLLIHVPEDDLPRWALPEGYLAGVSIASSDLKREASINRLAESGYSLELCKQVYDEWTDEGKAAEVLQKMLLLSDQDSTDMESLTSDDKELSSETSWEEETSSLHAVLGERFIRVEDDVFQILLDPVNYASGSKLIIQIRKSPNYPQEIPIVSIHAMLPAYIRLSILRKSLVYAMRNFSGKPMLFFLVDWVEQNFHNILENPGKLREVSIAASAASKATPVKREKQLLPAQQKSLERISISRTREGWMRWQESPEIQLKIQQRMTLPAWEKRESIVATIMSHQVTIISGETGSGKSTQCVQFLLDGMYEKNLCHSTKIICTQPRRISAIGLADRVSDERHSPVGQEVGYIIRGESKVSHTTKITFVTTGVLLRKLQNSGGGSDFSAGLSDISHVIIDEVHERSLDTDLLLALMKDILKKRKDLKLVLMSATLDAKVFEDYFKALGEVGQIEIKGRTYPVEDYYLDDVIRMTGFCSSNMRVKQENEPDIIEGEARTSETLQAISTRINYVLLTCLVREINSNLSSLGQKLGILIFMPGVYEINQTLDHLRSVPNLHLLPLHASLQSVEQRNVFSHAPPGKRKVVVATNVAETSITIDDILVVIDSGRVKETSYDAINQIRKLEDAWASRAACKQRRGRAGRVQAGMCYKLFTKELEMNKMTERPEPEIRRVPLEQLCLSVRGMGIKEVSKFLANALTPPESLAVHSAMKLLERMGALNGDELTALGCHLSMIPADLRCGKLMVYGAIFGCLDACVTIAAILTTHSPFVSPKDKKEQSTAMRGRFSQNHGDLIGDLRAYEQWDEIRSNKKPETIRSWCFENFLSQQNLNDISSNKNQFLNSLRDLSFIPSSASVAKMKFLNRHNSNNSLIRSLCAGAFNPQIARISFPEKKFAPSFSGAFELDPEARTIKYFNEENGRVFVHPSSTIFKAQGFPGNSVYLAYFNKMATSKVFIRDLTPFNSYTALLFSGPITLDTFGRGITVDGWLCIRGWARIGVLISRMRYMLDDILAKKIDDPELDLIGNEVVEVVLRLVELNGLDR